MDCGEQQRAVTRGKRRENGQHNQRGVLLLWCLVETANGKDKTLGERHGKWTVVFGEDAGNAPVRKWLGFPMREIFMHNAGSSLTRE